MRLQSVAGPIAAAALVLAAAQGKAQAPAATAQSAAPQAAPTAACCTIPARTVVEIEFVDPLSSHTSHVADSFRFRLAEPLSIGNRIVIPAGTPGVGEVVWAAKARAGGKAGELILAARYLELNGTRIALRTLHYGRSQGRDNSGAVNTGALIAAATIPLASVLGYLISGGEVTIAPGARANAQTSAEVVLPPQP